MSPDSGPGSGGDASADLDLLLSRLSPRRVPGEFVFVVEPEGARVPPSVVMASVVEEEGRSLVIRRSDADALGLSHDFVAAWITLDVASSLETVGLTAVVATALKEAGIACNVIAGFHHDHLLVPVVRIDEVLDLLRRLATRGY